MKKILYFTLLLFSSISWGQGENTATQLERAIADTPSEKIFVHYNSSLLFVGEYLYYKLYCLDAGSGAFSELSKIAYVELVDENGKSVFKHKLALDGGTGQGDFFFPSSVASGNYKLLGYTNRNYSKGTEGFFQADLVVVNPYTNAQEALLSTQDPAQLGMLDQNSPQAGSWGEVKLSDVEEIGLKTDAKVYRQRQKVVLDIVNAENLPGQYSISVRKLDPMGPPARRTAVGFDSALKASEGKGAAGVVALPEVRGELFRGKISPREGSGNVSVADQEVALSIPGENFVLKISRTNSEGEFFFNVDTPNIETQAVVQVMGKDRENFEIQLEQGPNIPLAQLDFKRFVITPEMKQQIVERSVHNQIENGYFEVKPDTLNPEPRRLPFYGDRMEVYELDDYNRFKTLKETFIEIITLLNVEKTASGDDVLRVTPQRYAIVSSMPPLLIVDGVMVQEQGDLIHYPADRIKSIGVIRDKYYLGPMVFQGVVAVETKEGDFNTGRSREYLHPRTLLRPLPEKRYFKQTYAPGQNKERVPDFRYQLLWQPSVKISAQQDRLEFFTSDVTGKFEISLEGFTDQGVPVSAKHLITVE